MVHRASISSKKSINFLRLKSQKKNNNVLWSKMIPHEEPLPSRQPEKSWYHCNLLVRHDPEPQIQLGEASTTRRKILSRPQPSWSLMDNKMMIQLRKAYQTHSRACEANQEKCTGSRGQLPRFERSREDLVWSVKKHSNTNARNQRKYYLSGNICTLVQKIQQCCKPSKHSQVYMRSFAYRNLTCRWTTQLRSSSSDHLCHESVVASIQWTKLPA